MSTTFSTITTETTSPQYSLSPPAYFDPKYFKFTCLDRNSHAEPSIIGILPNTPNPAFEADTRKNFNKKERKQRHEILQRHQQELMTIYMTPVMKNRSKLVREHCERDVLEELKRLERQDRVLEEQRREYERKVAEIEKLERELEEASKPQEPKGEEEAKVEDMDRERVKKWVQENMVYGYMALCAVFFLLALFPDLRDLLTKLLLQ